MTERDLQRWSREVAEDPGSPSFVRLARAYRRQDRRDAARAVVLAGLEANPEHVDGHALLALLHLESGEREQARDEWETILRLDPGNFDAGRGLGFLALERGDLVAARRHLEMARGARPEDPAVRDALALVTRRAGEAERAPASAPRSGRLESLFDPLTGDGRVLGAVLLDAQGLVLAGRVQGRSHEVDLVGGVLRVAVAEAERTAGILQLGAWDALVVETDGAALHMTALDGDAVLVLVAAPDAPRGWVARVAGRARTLADEFLEAPR